MIVILVAAGLVTIAAIVRILWVEPDYRSTQKDDVVFFELISRCSGAAYGPLTRCDRVGTSQSSCQPSPWDD
jgi:hypothetical protein